MTVPTLFLSHLPFANGHQVYKELMKEIIPIPKSLSYLIIGIVATITLILIWNVIKSRVSWDKEFEKFRSLGINSKLYGPRDLQRGNCEIKVKHNEVILSFDLPIAYDVEKHNIKTGDSLSKKADTGTFDIYRVKNS